MDLTVSCLSHVYPGRKTRPALEAVDFTVPSGQFVALVGPSGCGKSTLLRLIASLIQPTAGRIEIDGGLTPSQAATAQHIAWMSQSPALLPWLTARDNIAILRRVLPEGTRLRLSPDEALSMVGLEVAAEAYPFTLSGGMQQRLALARLLTLDSSLWLMDEPFAALDELTRERLSQDLLELWQPLRPTVLWVTHNIYEALRLANRVLVFTPQPGRIAADIDVPLPYPREEADPAFQQVLLQVRQALSLNRNQYEAAYA